MKDNSNTLSKDNFICENKGFIYNIASNICKRKLDWLNDDELSIAMIAFNSACDSYKSDKGNFYSYAKVLIKNALIDFFRKSIHNPYLEFIENDTVQNLEDKASITEYEQNQENLIRAEEIKLFSIELKNYSLSIDELVKLSPSHIDTRNNLLNIAFMCSREDSILQVIKNKKVLPLKEIILLTGAKRKLLDKWRKYILAIILIISSNDYPYIKSYFNIKVGEKNE